MSPRVTAHSHVCDVVGVWLLIYICNLKYNIQGNYHITVATGLIIIPPGYFIESSTEHTLIIFLYYYNKKYSHVISIIIVLLLYLFGAKAATVVT